MIGMEYAASKASPSNSKPPTLASSTDSIRSNKQPNGQPSAVQSSEDDEDPQIQLIETLRTQLTDTHNQLAQLNSKLVQSYDRVSHLEDTLEFANNNLNNAKSRIVELEAAKQSHEAALETGVLVEREHVAHELSRLMERATEEAAQRGKADAARSRIETELDDLSADLFARANTMVAEARIARAASERRVEEAEGALKSAEDAVKSMQIQMQQMAEARREDEMKVAEMRAKMGKGKWVERDDGGLEVDGPRRRLYNSHTVYREFTAFVSHLRGVRATAGVMPQLSALTSLPFVARLIVEDCDPTLRLDLAPALNWLTRRAVHGAVLQGQLEIEPVYGLQEGECALCGSNPNGHSLPGSTATSPTTATHALSPKSNQASGPGSMAAWASSTSKYFKGAMASPTTSPQASMSLTQSPLHRTSVDPNAPAIYIFRVANAQTNAAAAPLMLCSGGWCLTRLRATCELCSFLKRGVIEKVWSEPPQIVAPPSQTSVLGSVVHALSRDKDSTQTKDKDAVEVPPVPPRRRQLSQLGSSIWEKGLGAFGSRSGSRSGTPGPEEPKETPQPVERRLPPPPAPAPAPAAAPTPSEDREKLSIVPPAPPPRARPVPPVPSKPETQDAHEENHEHHEDIPHAMVFDAADDEHGHHALSPTTDKRHSIPITLTGPLRPITMPKSPTDTLATLPETVVSEAHHSTAEEVTDPATPMPKPEAPVTESGAPVPETAPAPATASEKAAESPQDPLPPSRPPRARLLAQEGGQRPMSPPGVPLPDSRPGTPAFSTRGVSPSRVRTPSPSRMRAASPNLGSPSPRVRRTGSIRRDVDSIRAASPVPGSPVVEGGPPKIPRRAPRRAAPVPPGTPSKAPAVERVAEKPEDNEAKGDAVEKKPEEAEKKVDEGAAKVEEDKPKTEEHKPEAEVDKPKTEANPVPRPPPRRAVPPPPAAPPLPARARGHELTHTSEAKSAEDSKPDEAKTVPENPVTESAPEQPTRADVPADTKEHVTSKPHVTALVTSTTNGSITQNGSDSTGKVNGVDKEQGNAESGEKKQTEEDAQFVGEQTWEERAYKEIVKLREDMFWARIGSAW